MSTANSELASSQDAGPGEGVARRTLVFTIEEVAPLLRLGRTAAYEAVRRGDIPTIRIGRRLLVPRAALERLLAEAGQRTAVEAEG